MPECLHHKHYIGVRPLFTDARVIGRCRWSRWDELRGRRRLLRSPSCESVPNAKDSTFWPTTLRLQQLLQYMSSLAGEHAMANYLLWVGYNTPRRQASQSCIGDLTSYSARRLGNLTACALCHCLGR